MNELFYHKGVIRSAPVTPGLLKIYILSEDFKKIHYTRGVGRNQVEKTMFTGLKHRWR